MDQKYTNDFRFWYNKDLDQNLAWLTQKTKEPKSNKENFTFLSHTVNMIELQSNKKVATPLFLLQPPPPFTGLSPLSSKKSCTPQVTQFLEGLILPLIRGGGEVPTMEPQ